MANTVDILTRDVTVINELGLHARSAAQIAELARQASGNVWVIKDDREADATSIIDILTLSASQGSRLTLRIDDRDDEAILQQITELIEDGFGE